MNEYMFEAQKLCILYEKKCVTDSWSKIRKIPPKLADFAKS